MSTPEDTPEALRARAFALIEEATTVPEGTHYTRQRAATLAVAYASLAQTAPREVTVPQAWSFPQEQAARVVNQIHAAEAHPQGAEQHPEDDGVDYTLGMPPEPIPADGRRVLANDPLGRSGLVVDHPFTLMRVDGEEACRACSYARFDHVTEEDEHGNEQPVHIAVPRAVLTGLSQVVEFFVQSDHYTPDGLSAQPDVRAAIHWVRSNL